MKSFVRVSCILLLAAAATIAEGKRNSAHAQFLQYGYPVVIGCAFAPDCRQGAMYYGGRAVQPPPRFYPGYPGYGFSLRSPGYANPPGYYRVLPPPVIVRRR